MTTLPLSEVLAKMQNDLHLNPRDHSARIALNRHCIAILPELVSTLEEVVATAQDDNTRHPWIPGVLMLPLVEKINAVLSKANQVPMP